MPTFKIFVSALFVGWTGFFFGSGAAAQVPYGSKLALVAHEGFYTPGPYRYVRANSDGSVFVMPIDGTTENDATNAEFRKVNGLADSSCISFESVKHPGYFLRHLSYDIRLAARPWNNPQWFKDAATFCLTIPVGGGNTQGYESYDWHEHYLRADGSSLVLREVNWDSQYPQDYDAITFHEVEGPVTLMLYNWGSLSAVPQIYTDGEYRVVQYNGACTGLAPWWGTPPTSTVRWWLEYWGKEAPLGTLRLVEKQVTATPFVGYYPSISFYIPLRPDMGPTTQNGYVAKIRTGGPPCVW